MLKQWTPEEKHVLRLYHNKCVNHPTRWAVTIHHEPPRSLNPDYMNQPETWFPVCERCHEDLHCLSRSDARHLLTENQARFYPEVKEFYDRR